MAFPASVKVHVRRVSCGGGQFAVVDIEGVVYTWGSGGGGRLGHGSAQSEGAPRVVAALAGQRVAMVSCGDEHTAVVTEQGQLWTWGRGSGQLGLGDQLTRCEPVRVMAGLPDGEAGVVREVSCGHTHTVVAMASGEVWRLGHGGTVRSLIPKVVAERARV